MNYYISDLHLGHANAIKFDKRPFRTVEEMTQTVIRNWNDAVSPTDTVYILGDMFWKASTSPHLVLQQLNGKKHLIRGNHDKNHGDWRIYESVADYADIIDTARDGTQRRVILCHYPIPCFNGHMYGAYHLYGHVHASQEYNVIEQTRKTLENMVYNDGKIHPCNMYNAGCMLPYMNYTPRTLDEIITGYNRV